MATKSTTLFSLDAVKAFLAIDNSNTSKDSILTTIADGVSDRVEKMTGRFWVTRSVTETFDGKGRAWAFLKTMPVASITSVRHRPSLDSAWETIDVDDTAIDTAVGRLWLVDTAFYSGPLSVEVVYSAGVAAQDDPALPSDLVLAALNWVKFVWQRDKVGIIASSANAAGNSVVVIGEPPKDVRDAIGSYRKFRVSLG